MVFLRSYPGASEKQAELNRFFLKNHERADFPKNYFRDWASGRTPGKCSSATWLTVVRSIATRLNHEGTPAEKKAFLSILLPELRRMLDRQPEPTAVAVVNEAIVKLLDENILQLSGRSMAEFARVSKKTRVFFSAVRGAAENRK